ncbi:MAG: acyl-CoA thioesterase [Bdellovibrionaceae bacterium]|nr:acyl-CoA thioesterase [Pseudobdellovibrionaceae bacterium]
MMALSDYSVLIREFHVDSLGHVNNATYLALLEEARWEVITGNGYGFSEVQKHKKGPVILEVNLKFMKEIRLRETITIKTEMADYTGKIGHIKQTILKQDGSVSAEALFTFGFFDLQTRRLIEPTPEWLKAIGM